MVFLAPSQGHDKRHCQFLKRAHIAKLNLKAVGEERFWRVEFLHGARELAGRVNESQND